jgi:N-ethylmaleimide reductase
VLIGNNGYSPETALKDIEDGRIDMVSFAKLFITNPDLYRRIVNGWPVKKEQDMRSWFGGGEKGYTDHPEYQV